MPAVSYLGAAVAVSANTPATVDLAGFGALAYTTVGFIASIGEIGDTAEDIAIQLLSGRTEHVNGARDGGEVPFAFRIEAPAGDAGQTILLTNNNTNTNVSFRITDPDGKLTYFFGVIASVRDMERTSSQYKGMTGVVRVNSATIRN